MQIKLDKPCACLGCLSPSRGTEVETRLCYVCVGRWIADLQHVCQRNFLALSCIPIDRVATIHASTAATCLYLYLSRSVSYSVMTCSHPCLLFLSLSLCLIGRCSGLLPRPEHRTLLRGGATRGRRRRRVPGPVGSYSWVQTIRGWTYV